MIYYPITFLPIYKETVWGGDRLAQLFGRTLPSNNIGESWDVSCRPHEMSVIENGPWAGCSLERYIAANKEYVLGKRLKNCKDFPFLIKLIDANDALSIQVHPGGEYGKSEVWYVLAPPTGGHLIIGLKPGITREALAAAYENGTIEHCLNHLPVKTGDIVNIPAGLVHALTPGVVVAEIQQNSDTTYRIYDYGRPGLDGKPRPLHVQDALAVSDFEGNAAVPFTGESIKIGENELTHYNCNEYFAVTKYDLAEPLTEKSNLMAFSIFTCVGGHAVIKTDSMAVEIPLGRSVFIPARMGGYSITPKGEHAILLKSTPIE